MIYRISVVDPSWVDAADLAPMRTLGAFANGGPRSIDACSACRAKAVR